MKSKGKKPVITAVVQARLGSNRYPEKMLENLGGLPVVDWVLRRLRMSSRLTNIVLATSHKPENDRLLAIAERIGVKSFRGNEDDVLHRTLMAAKNFRSDIVVRVCADNPFICPGMVDNLVDFFISNDFDYAFNHGPKGGACFADGFGAEIMNFSILEKINMLAVRPEEREHTTLFVWNNMSLFKIGYPNSPRAVSEPTLRFDIDYPRDLVKLQKLVDEGVNVKSNAAEIVRCALKIPGFEHV